MIKLVLRYVIALVMIPVGIVLGFCGAVQNHLRRHRYQAKHAELQQQLADQPAENRER